MRYRLTFWIFGGGSYSRLRPYQELKNIDCDMIDMSMADLMYGRGRVWKIEKVRVD